MPVRVKILTRGLPHPWQCAKGVWRRIPGWVKVVLFFVMVVLGASIAGPPR